VSIRHYSVGRMAARTMTLYDSLVRDCQPESRRTGLANSECKLIDPLPTHLNQEVGAWADHARMSLALIALLIVVTLLWTVFQRLNDSR
jgi:hypothetical protein